MMIIFKWGLLYLIWAEDEFIDEFIQTEVGQQLKIKAIQVKIRFMS